MTTESSGTIRAGTRKGRRENRQPIPEKPARRAATGAGSPGGATYAGLSGQLPGGGVLDEVQNTPDLFSYLRTRGDQKERSGLYILTGSRQFDLLSGITQTLAGQVAFLSLLPLSQAELVTGVA